MRISDWSSDVCSSDLLAVEGDAERVAVTQAPDLRRDRALVVKGVVARHAACVGEAYDLAQVCVPVLRGVELLALAAGNIEKAVGREGEAMAVTAASRQLRVLATNNLHALDPRRPAPAHPQHQPTAHEARSSGRGRGMQHR